MENIKTPPDKNINTEIKVYLSFNYNSKIKLSEKMTLSELKKKINKIYFLSDDEYQLFIGGNNINKEPNTTLVEKLIEKYNSKNINIKSHKYIFDLQNQLNSYDNFLTKKISLKTDEINFLTKEIANLKNDLNNI